MRVNVSMAVEVRRREARVDHSIDLRQAFTLYVRSIQKSKRGTCDQHGQRVELAGVASCQRTRGGERAAGREIQMNTERKAGNR